MEQNNGMLLLQSLSEAISGLAESVSPSVVRVESGRWSGTGVVWDKEGHVVTANHAVSRRNRVSVQVEGGKSLEGEVVGRDPISDIALIKVESADLKPLQLGDSTGLKSGQFVLAFANSGTGKVSITSGIVTNPSRTIPGWWGVVIEDAVITDARLNPGYSGGPLVDAFGKIIGMNTAYAASRGIAIPVNTLRTVVDRLGRDGRIKRGYLGITADPVSLPEDLAAESGARQDGGIMVLSVERDSPAKKAGLSMGDIILKLDETQITSLYELHKALREQAIGKATSLWVLRGGKLVELKITPSEAAER